MKKLQETLKDKELEDAIKEDKDYYDLKTESMTS